MDSEVNSLTNKLVEGEDWPGSAPPPPQALSLEWGWGVMGQALTVNSAPRDSHPEGQDSKSGQDGLPVFPSPKYPQPEKQPL